MQWSAQQRFQKARRSQRRTAEPERLVFRMGINLGDVALVDGDVYGDGVNVAARLEQLADPGGVMVSGTAYDHLQGKLHWPLDFIREHRVKNITRPVRAIAWGLTVGERAGRCARRYRDGRGPQRPGHSTAFDGRRDLVVLAARTFERHRRRCCPSTIMAATKPPVGWPTA